MTPDVARFSVFSLLTTNIFQGYDQWQYDKNVGHKNLLHIKHIKQSHIKQSNIKQSHIIIAFKSHLSVTITFRNQNFSEEGTANGNAEETSPITLGTKRFNPLNYLQTKNRLILFKKTQNQQTKLGEGEAQGVFSRTLRSTQKHFSRAW